MSDSNVKIAKKSTHKKYSASGKTVHVKRGDTLRKIAKRYHVEGRLEGFVEAQQEDDQESELDLYRTNSQDQIDLTGAGGTLPPVCPPVEARQTRICRASGFVGAGEVVRP